MEKEFTQDERTIIFFKEPDDEKYHFKIKNDQFMTQLLHLSVKQTVFKEKDIKFAVKGLFEKIERLDNNSYEYEAAVDALLAQTKAQNTAKKVTNPIAELNEICQRRFYRGNIEFRTIEITGPDHRPTISVMAILPDGRTFRGLGASKKEAKQNAAIAALTDLK